MKIKITARQVKLSRMLDEYVRKKIARLDGYNIKIVNTDVKLMVEKYRHIVEIVIYARKEIFKAQVTTSDLYSSIDMAVDKIEQQIRKYKDKIKVRRHGKKKYSGFIEETRLTSLHQKETENFLVPEQLQVKNLTVKEAMDTLKTDERPFCIFWNRINNKLTVMYRRPDGNYDLLEPQI